MYVLIGAVLLSSQSLTCMWCAFAKANPRANSFYLLNNFDVRASLELPLSYQENT